MKNISKIIAIIFCFLTVFCISGCESSNSIATKYNKYNVTFLDYDGTILKDEIVQHGQDAIAPEEPIRYGYIFIGWDKQYTNVTSNLLIKAKYERNYNEKLEFTVTFKDYDGTILKEEKVLEGLDATAPELKDKAGYTFIGWSKACTNIQENCTIIATYQRLENVYIVHFDSNGGSEVESKAFTKDTLIFKPNNPIKEGYSFKGWYYNGLIWDFREDILKEDITLEAQWIEEEFNFRENSGANYIEFGRYPQEIITDSELISELNKITETNEYGYIEYDGNEYYKEVSKYWCGYDGDGFPGLPEIRIGETYYYKVKPISWRIIEDGDGNYTLLSENVLEGISFGPEYNRIVNGEIIYPNNYEYSNIRAWLNGYDGSSYEVENFAGLGFFNRAFTKDEQELIINSLVDNSLYSVGDLKNINICNSTFDKIFLLSASDLSDPKYGLDKLYTKTNYYGDTYEIYSDRLANATDYAFSKGVSYFLSNYYTTSGGTPWLLRTAGKNNKVSGVSDISDIGESNVNTTSYGIRPALKLSLKEIGDNKVIFKDYNGNPLKLEYVNDNENATPPTPNRIGYTFVGWDKEYTNIQGDLEIYAQYIPNIYEITLDLNGGDPLNENVLKIEYNSIFDITPVRDGYTFLGWYMGDECIELGNWNITKDTGLKAIWLNDNEHLKIVELETTKFAYFGRYPQTVVTDETLIKSLDLITKENEFGYIEYEGNEYKKVVANPYNDNYTFINGQRIVSENVYYFKVEPIKWRILEESDGTYKLLSDIILDNNAFYPSYSNRTINKKTIYPNNYQYSNIRAWLNGYDGTSYEVEDYTNTGFLNIAFTSDEQALINNTFVDNSYAAYDEYEKKYMSNNTLDKIYLLSNDDISNENYGFNKYAYENDVTRQAQVSDYARSKNCYVNFDDNYGIGEWLLRTPCIYDSFYAYIIMSTGRVFDETNVKNASNGIRPALTVSKELFDGYQVVFRDYDDNVLKVELVQDKENATPPTNPSREHYNFIGWDKEYINVQSDLEITAMYEEIKYLITLDVNGGDPLASDQIELAYNQIFDITPVKDGYKFLGWFNGEEKVDLGPWLIQQNVTLKAYWLVDNELANIIKFENNTYVYFGRYPQTVVTDETIINELSKIEDENDFGYLEYNGNEYKKVTESIIYDYGYKFKNGNIIEDYNVYYFLVEPIKWRILEENKGTYKLLSDIILDSTTFYQSSSNRTVDGKIIYPNNYEYSNVRAWLNGYDGTSYNVANYTGIGFLDIAFTDAEKEIINNTLVDNSLASTGDSSNSYICNNTFDKIYLLSYKDITNENYGFSSDEYEYDSTRRMLLSDYTRVQYTYMNTYEYYGCGNWLLRSPSYYKYYAYHVYHVYYNGEISELYISSTRQSICPALIITLSE